MTDPAFVTAQVLENRAVARDHFVLTLGLPTGWGEPAPGQFVDLGCRDARLTGRDPLLLRPFSVYRRQADRLELLIRVVGAGTALLGQARPGDELPLLGPLGRGFGVRTGRVALVGGGVGVPPLVFLGERWRAAGGEPLALIGFQSADLAVCTDDFAALSIDCRIATEDGSLGRAGRVTALLEEALAAGALDAVCACGPVPMLRAVAELGQRYGVPTEVCFEALMGCAMGVCLSCVVPVGGDRWRPSYSGYARVCREGPVFGAEEVAWHAL